MRDLSDLSKIVEELDTLDIDEIKRRVSPLMEGMTKRSPVLDAGAFLYRGRRLGSQLAKSAIRLSDLSYPPPEHCRLGRANRKGSPLFYCSADKGSLLYELRALNVGDEVVVGFWQTTETRYLNNIGYTQFVFDKLGAKRAVPTWRRKDEPGAPTTIDLPATPPDLIGGAMARDKDGEISQVFSEHFMSDAEPARYKLTAAISELHLGKIDKAPFQFAGIMYPSVRMWANGDNVALLPWFADNHLELRKAAHIRIDRAEGQSVSYSTLDEAIEFNDRGELNWLGRMLNWTLKTSGQEARAVATAGRDRHGDYIISKEGTPVHWVITDVATGLPIDPH